MTLPSGLVLGAGRLRARLPRVECATDYAADGGVVTARVACNAVTNDLLALALPETTDLSATGTARVVLRPETVDECVAWRVLRVTRYAAPSDFAAPGAPTIASVAEWRILRTRDVIGDDGAGVRELTLGPRLADWGMLGRIRATADGHPVWRFAAVTTVADALTAWVLPYVAARGRAGWTLGAIGRTDAQLVELDRSNPQEALRTLAARWTSEIQERRLSDSTWALDLPVRVGAGATPITVRPTRADGTPGALVRAERTVDATALATSVAPLTSDGVGLARAAWRFDAADVGTGWCDVVDPASGPGPVQVDGQLVGATVQVADGSYVVILDSAANDGLTSQLQLADASGITPGGDGVGDELELRADGTGTLLVAVRDPAAAAAPPAGYGDVETPLDVEGDQARNTLPNAYGQAYSSTTGLPTGWAYVGNPAGSDPTLGPRPGGLLPIERVALPVGAPVGSGTGWLVSVGYALDGVDWPLAPAIDPVPGDAVVSYAIAMYVDVPMAADNAPNPGDSTPGIRAQLIDDTGAVLASVTSWSGQTWLTLGLDGVTLTALARCTLRLTWALGFVTTGGSTFSRGPGYFSIGPTPDHYMPVYLAGGILARARAVPDAWPLTPHANRLHQLATAHLLGHRAPPTALSLALRDDATLDPARYGDRPVVLGGTLTAAAPASGFTATGRVRSRTPDELAPGVVQLELDPDPGLADAVAAASPRPLTLTEQLAAGATGSGAAGAGGGTGGGPLIITAYQRYDPRRYGASGLPAEQDVDVTDAVQRAADWGKQLLLDAGCVFGVEHVDIAGHYYPQPAQIGSGPARPYRVHGGGALRQLANTNATIVTFNRMDGLIVRDCEFHGNRTNQTTANWGLYCVDVNYSRFSYNTIHQTSGSGVVFSTSANLSDEQTFVGNEIIFCGGYGLYYENCGDHALVGNHIDYNDWEGVYAVSCYTISLLGNHILSNFGSGVILDTCRHCIVGSGNMLRENKANGLVLVDGVGGHSVSNLRALWNSISSTNTYDGIVVDGCPNVRITDCESNDDWAISDPFYPVSSTSRQRYGLRANNATGLRLLGNNFTPSATAATHFTGTTAGTALFNVGLADGAF